MAAVAVALAVALFWLGALYGIRSPFYYGHYGYHGGSYATWARGTLRQHTLLPVNEPGFAPPRPGTYYIHHPIYTHQLVTLTFALFGEHEWSVRLGALIPAFASLLLVSALAWRHLGAMAGAVAALVFSIVPVNVWYNVNIDQGFPSIACLLAFFWFYLRWLQTGRWTLAWAALVFQALAGGFEWSPYFAFPAIFAHVAWTGARRRGRHLIFAVLHPLAIIVPLGAHVVAVWKSGMLSDLMGAYRTRAAEVGYRHFAVVMGQYGETLYGKVLLVFMFVWLISTGVRVVRGRGRAIDLVGLTFAFALLTYVHVFKNAVITHAYRQLYGNVWAALATADLVTRGGRMAQGLAVRLSRRREIGDRIGIAAACALTLVALGGTAPVAWAGLLESRAHGGIPGWKTFNPDLRQTAFAHQVNLATRPGDVLYFHPTFASPPPSRMDWAFYYDRDLRRGWSLRVIQSLPAADLKRAVVLLAPAVLAGDERRAYAELSRQHALLLIDDLAALDLRGGGQGVRAFSSAPGREGPNTGSAVARWLDGPYPMPRLLPDPRRQAADADARQMALAQPSQPPPATVLPRAPIAASRSPTAPIGHARGAAITRPAGPGPGNRRRRRPPHGQTR